MRDPREGLTTEGHITTGALRSRVPSSFEPVLREASRVLAPRVEELHLYGSVATGAALRPRSDVDLLAVGADPEEMAQVGAELGERFGALCRGVAIGTASPADFRGDDHAAYGNRVFLRHYCVPLLGDDAYRSPHPFLGDVDAARGFNGDVAEHLDRWRAVEPTAALAPRVARKTLFAVAGLVSVADHTWTTDRATAATRWGELRPWWRSRLSALEAWTRGAPATPTEVADALADDGVVQAVVGDVERQVGLWR